MLFEPDHASLEPLGIAAVESVLESTDGNHVLLVLENYSGIVAHVEPSVPLGKVSVLWPLRLIVSSHWIRRL